MKCVQAGVRITWEFGIIDGFHRLIVHPHDIAGDVRGLIPTLLLFVTYSAEYVDTDTHDT